MDPVKLVLTVCLAAFFGMMSFVFSIAVMEALSGRPIHGAPHPGLVRGIQWACLVPVLGFAWLGVRTLRSAWQQITEPPWTADQSEADLKEVVVSVRSGRFDLTRLTGAGWLLGIASLALPVAGLTAIVTTNDGFLDGRPPRIVGFGLLLVAGVTFGLGRLVLKAIGIRLIQSDIADPASQDEEC